MAYIQVRDRQYPLSSRVRIGTAEGVDVRLEAGDGREGEATVVLTRDGQALIRSTGTSPVKVNGVALGPEGTPLLHGDKIDVAGTEVLFGDDQQVGSTQYVPSVDIESLNSSRAAARRARPAAGTGGRLVSQVDGREYPVPDGGLLIGRDAGCDVVVPITEVSRRHAEIIASGSGYQLNDLSTNGVLVNGARVDKSHTLGRGDVVRIANAEFRFYADAAPATAAPNEGAPADAGAPPAAPAKPPASAPAPAPAIAAAGSEPTPALASPPLQATAAPVVVRPALATLEIINEGVNKGETFELRTPLSHVGRGPHNDVAIDDESVSDSHAKLQKREGGWFVVDMGSTNGTYVGGRRIDGERRLEGSPDIRFGGVKMTFRPAAEPVDAAKGTRAFTAPKAEDIKRASAAKAPAQRPAASRGVPETASPPSAKFPWWIAIAAIALIAIAAFFIVQGR
jgi:pSer/pThr/pTyr-binding forkhead associated (FHA) protein